MPDGGVQFEYIFFYDHETYIPSGLMLYIMIYLENGVWADKMRNRQICTAGFSPAFLGYAGNGESRPSPAEANSVIPVFAEWPGLLAAAFLLTLFFFVAVLGAIIAFLGFNRAVPLLASPDNMGHPAEAVFFQYHEAAILSG
jgi:hypothetical protein